MDDKQAKPVRGDYIDPLTEEDERIMERVDALFTEEDMDEWARQLEAERTEKEAQKGPRTSCQSATNAGTSRAIPLLARRRGHCAVTPSPRVYPPPSLAMRSTTGSRSMAITVSG